MCILLHETSSGFSPPSATKIRRMGRAARNGVDRTAYCTRHKKKPFVTYHTQRISKNIVHCDATATLEKIAGAKARLSNILLVAGATQALKPAAGPYFSTAPQRA